MRTISKSSPGSLLLTGFSLVCCFEFDPKTILETDLSRLRNRESLTRGPAYLSRYLDEIFQHYLSPMAVLPQSRENAIKIKKALQNLKAQQDQRGPNGTQSLIASVQDIDDFLPTQQKEKIKIIQEIQRLISPLLPNLTRENLKLAKELLNPWVLKPITEKDLPPLILHKFSEIDGTIGKMILVEPSLSKELNQGDHLIGFIQAIRNTADSIEPGVAIASSLAISADMIQSVAHDGPIATLFAFLAVVALVILLFRNLGTIALALFALFLGITWLAGFILFFKLKINFLNFIALPITFGIGVDYGVNIFQRYKETEGKEILKVIESTGSAVALSSFSTIVGYTSLLIARNQGFVSFGLLAVTGELTCVIAALIALPAYLMIRERRRLKFPKSSLS